MKVRLAFLLHRTDYITQHTLGHSTASAYLTDEILARPNLTVAVSVFTEKIIFKTINGDEPRAVGVQICKEKNGSKFVVRANKEIILSAGALGSPHLLLLSGIGPSTQLSAFGIPLVRELSQVGEHLLDVSKLYKTSSVLSNLTGPLIAFLARRH